MKLYQTHLGYAITIKAEIGDTDDGWRVNDGTAVPRDARVEVVYRDGSRDPSLRASDLIWNDSSHPRDVVAYRIIQPKLQLELGGIYRARDGAIYGPLIASKHRLYPFRTPTHSWTVNGALYSGAICECASDLVEHIATAPGDGWIAHNKNEMPSLPDDTIVEVVTRGGRVQTGDRSRPAGGWCWGTPGQSAAILAYRIVPTPKPSIQLEVGGIYRDREGNTHGPLVASKHGTYPFRTADHSWTVNGAVWATAVVESPHDLVEHIATEAAPKLQLTLEERVARLEAHLA